MFTDILILDWSIRFPYHSLLQLLLQLLFLLNLPLLRYTLSAKTLQSQVQHQPLRHQIQSRMMIFRLLSVKLTVSVFTQYLRLFPITICHLPLVPLLHLDSISLPNTVSEALSHPSWHSVMVEEMQALIDNSTSSSSCSFIAFAFYLSS